MKTKKYLKMEEIYLNNKKYLVIYERIRNDYYGKPRFNISYFNDENNFIININLTSYDIEKDIKYYILENFKEEI